MGALVRVRRQFGQLARGGDRRVAVAYVRGTEAERAAQVARLRAWAADAVEIRAVLEDGPGRGEELARPGLVAALDAVRRERAGLLLVSHWAVAIECTGAPCDALHVLCNDAGARLRSIATKPPPAPPAPFGWRKTRGGRLEPDAYEQAVIAAVRELRELPQSEIARQLAATGLTGRTGQPLARRRVADILRGDAT